MLSRRRILGTVSASLLAGPLPVNGQLADLAARYRPPAMYEFGEYVKAGGLLSYGPSILDVYRKAASYDFDAGFKAMRAADGLLRANAPLFTTHRARLVGLAAKSRLPAMYGQREYVEVGGFMSYGPHQVIE